MNINDFIKISSIRILKDPLDDFEKSHSYRSFIIDEDQLNNSQLDLYFESSNAIKGKYNIIKNKKNLFFLSAECLLFCPLLITQKEVAFLEINMKSRTLKIYSDKNHFLNNHLANAIINHLNSMNASNY